MTKEQLKKRLRELEEEQRVMLNDEERLRR